jgi:hypothetical protein
VAQYRLSVQTIQRALGRSSVAAAAYRATERLQDERLAMEFDFSKKERAEHTEIMLPQGAPAAFADRETLWNAAEACERRKDAVPAQEILLSLPHELNLDQRRELVRDFVREHVTAKGMIADVAMHRPGKDGDQRNFHAHILITTRHVDRSGFGQKNRDWHHSSFVARLRSAWAETQNVHLRRHLGPNAPQVSHLSLAEQGIDRVPTVRMGPTASALERKHIASERGEQNREVKAKNRKVREVHVELEATIDRIAKKEPELLVGVPQLVEDARELRDGMVAERDGWKAEKDALAAPKIPSVKQVERELTADAAGARERAKVRLDATEDRVKKTRSKRLELVQWVRNPARMIWAKHAELNAISRARSEYRRADAQWRVRQAWVRSPGGQTYIAARRQPALDHAATVHRQGRTLERKIKRMDRRITSATRAYNELRVAEELGVTWLKVPNNSPDATRFIRGVTGPTREALAQFPEQAKQLAVDRLNRGQGRAVTRALGLSR